MDRANPLRANKDAVKFVQGFFNEGSVKMIEDFCEGRHTEAA